MLTEILQDKNINLAKLSESTGISERFLKALIEEKYEKLPAAPYIRSYLFKIADALNVDGQKLWQEYQKNTQLRKSGTNDHLPINRFSPKPLNKKIIFALIFVILAGYLAFQYNFFLGKPTLSLLGQLASSTSPITDPNLKIEGRVKSGDQLMINKENTYIDENGYFQKDFPLQPGQNNIQFQIKRFLGREITITKQVLYLPK
ncbi:MAG: helix-turn-helix domain-containing protein [bacterium]|nr:helix-turn-helix domain-containing protein [bacterium]